MPVRAVAAHPSPKYFRLNAHLPGTEDYLAKEECTAGAHGIEARYPFLDRSLV